MPLLALLLLIFSHNIMAATNYQIATTSRSIASLAAMIADDKAKIHILNSNSGSQCIHNHHVKPSDVNILRNADLIIYVGSHFERKLHKSVKHLKNQITFEDLVNNRDGHIWLNLDNALVILQRINNYLSTAMPEHKDFFAANLITHKKNLRNLSKKINNQLTEISDGKVIIAHNALRYFMDYFKLQYEYSNRLSPRKLRILEKQQPACILTSHCHGHEKQIDKISFIDIDKIHNKIELSDFYSHMITDIATQITSSCKK